jgi:segregation and condensation protein A
LSTEPPKDTGNGADDAGNRAALPGAHQSEMPFALVQGQPVTQLPEDLYIPPDALEVILEAFEGPLDLLLYLIRRQNLDILDIPIAEISRQYVAYVDILKDVRFDLAAEYLVMAAILAEIKSRMLLPRPASEEEDEADPRAELVRRLQEYERFKQAAEDLDELPLEERDFTVAAAFLEELDVVKAPPEVELADILSALRDVMSRADMFTHHHIEQEPLSVRERMSIVVDRLRAEPYLEFQRLFTVEEGRMGVVVTFLALMELSKEHLVDIIQHEPMGQIYVKAPSPEEH